jgi:cytochrome c oxidase cbb3-type subunit 3
MASRALVACAGLALAVGCDSLPGRPRPEARPVRPSQVTDFAALYAQNCAGCHGGEVRPGAAVALADPVYLAFADDAALRLATARGVAGTAMPAFARSRGGTLTDEQIEILVSGMRARWARPDALDGGALPAYAAAPGDAARGAQVYATWCAACHGPAGGGGEHGGSVVDGSYLGLVSDQGLRTAVVVGRPALGMPDWRGGVPGRPMSVDDVADVVAWLIARRPEFPGQPYPTPIATRDPHDG